MRKRTLSTTPWTPCGGVYEDAEDDIQTLSCLSQIGAQEAWLAQSPELREVAVSSSASLGFQT